MTNRKNSNSTQWGVVAVFAIFNLIIALTISFLMGLNQ